MILVSMTSCMPCKMVKQYIKENNIEGIEVMNVEDHEDLVEKYSIKQTPSLILDDDTVLAGKDKIIGYFEGEEEDE